MTTKGLQLTFGGRHSSRVHSNQNIQKLNLCTATKLADMEKRVKVLFDKYANFITASPETTGDVEMLVKYLSYFVSGELS